MAFGGFSRIAKDLGFTQHNIAKTAIIAVFLKRGFDAPGLWRSAGLAMTLFLIGAVLLSLILGLFWLKDRMKNPMLAGAAYSGLVARLAVIAAVFMLLGILLMLSEFSVAAE